MVLTLHQGPFTNLHHQNMFKRWESLLIVLHSRTFFFIWFFWFFLFIALIRPWISSYHVELGLNLHLTLYAQMTHHRPTHSWAHSNLRSSFRSSFIRPLHAPVCWLHRQTLTTIDPIYGHSPHSWAHSKPRWTASANLEPHSSNSTYTYLRYDPHSVTLLYF